MPFLAFADNKEHKQTLEQLYCQYGKPLSRIAEGILKDPHLAEDALQIMFIKLARYLKGHQLPAAEKLRPFLVTMIKYTAIDLYRKRQRRPEMQELGEEVYPSASCPPVPTPEEVIVSRETCRRLISYIGELSPIHQEVLWLRYFYGMTEKEIAVLLGVTRGTVCSRLFRARNRLKERLAKEGEGQ